MNEKKMHYFAPPGFMCEDCLGSHDTVAQSVAVRISALRAQLPSMEAVFQQQKEWSDAMLCVYCGSTVNEVYQAE